MLKTMWVSLVLVGAALALMMTAVLVPRAMSTTEAIGQWHRSTDPYQQGGPVDMRAVLEHQLELRRRVGPLLSTIDPTQSTCASCGSPWSLTEPHDIALDNSQSVFALCESCFRTLRTLGRSHEIVALYKSTYDTSWSESLPWDILENAVRLDLRTP